MTPTQTLTRRPSPKYKLCDSCRRSYHKVAIWYPAAVGRRALIRRWYGI